MQPDLSRLAPDGTPASWLTQLVAQEADRPPLPGHGATLERWRVLAAVAAHDLSLAKLYEGHTDAIAILTELDAGHAAVPGSTWGTWAAEPPSARVLIREDRDGAVLLEGRKAWCSGGEHVSHGLLTAWHADGRGPQLVRVDMRQDAIRTDASAWEAVGMALSSSVDILFSGARGVLVGREKEYLSRPGFWHGGAGIAACWFGGSLGLAQHLRRSFEGTGNSPDVFRAAALGKVDVSLAATAAILREAARHIDGHPKRDARAVALRARLAAEQCARQVIDEVGRALGAGPFCRDAKFARLAADLPVFVRQSHAERDFAALAGSATQGEPSGWAL